MKKNYQFPFLKAKQMLKNGMLIVALLAISMGYSQSEDTIQLGDGEETASYFPFYHLYKFSYSQTVYTAEELYLEGALEEATSITTIKYKPTTSQSSSNWKDWVVYIGNTDKEGFDDETDWVSSDDMSEVFDGQLPDEVNEDEWVEITLDTPFEWDGTSNIVIAVDQNTENWGSNPDWAGYTLAPENGSKGIYYYDDNTNPNPDDPPTEGGNLGVENKVAQIQLVGEFLVSCDGTPTAGTVEEDDLNVCAGIDFSVSVFGASNPANGLEFIWQSSPAGEDDWTDIDGATTSTYTVQVGIEESTDFRYEVTCTNSDETDISDVITVTLNPDEDCYCIPDGASDNADDISNFSIGDLDNDSDSGSSTTEPGYSDFSESVDSVELVPGESYEASLTSGSGSGNHGAAIWIDYNDDGLFSSFEKVATISSSISGGTTVTFPEFTIENNPGMHRLRVQYTYNKDGVELDPCEVTTPYSETEDYTVEIIELDACAGTPTAGTIDDDFGVCANIAFSVSVSEASDPAGGLERIWQSSPEGEGDWADIEGATLLIYNVNDGIDEPKDFRYKVTCTNSDETDISDVVTVTLNPAEECYCVPINSSNESYYISNFTTDGALEDIDKTSGFSDGGYADYTETDIITVYAGQEIDISASSLISFNYQYKVWLDLNQNGSFEDAGENILSSAGYVSNPYTDTYTVPSTLSVGDYRLRVRNAYTSGPPTPCGDFDYGEAEDYILKVIEVENCQGTPAAGTIDEDFSICAGDAFSISVSGASEPANGLERNWQSSPAGEDGWTNIDGATSSIYSVADGLTEPTDFRYKLTCDNSNETAISDIVEVTLNPANECYCAPDGASDNSDEIVNFTLGDLDNDSDSGSSISGYSDFTDSVDSVDLISGESYEASLTAGPGSGNHGAAIWIDYNDDGLFDSSEKVATLGIIISGGDTVTFPEFTVPDSPGMHQLRVQYTKGQHGGDLEPCQVSTSSSETEDYKVNIVEGNCPTPSDVSVDVENTTVVVDWTENGSATEWELIYGAPGFNPETDGTTVTVQEKPTAISDLDPETDYEVYIIAICDDENSSDLSDSRAFTTGELSVDNPLFENFTFYPNPVKGQLTLKAGMQIENVSVYNLLGQNVLSSKPNTVEAQLNTERLQSGIYLMKVTIDGNTKIFRLIKR